MEMHWMGYWCKIVDDESVARIATSIIDVPFGIRWIRYVALLCK
jgi:hypothetical protein